MSFSTLLRISRPRFRHYVLGPMLLLFAGAEFFTIDTPSFAQDEVLWRIILLVIILGYFTLPANLWIYGRNDIADGDTDIHNRKKGEYENLLLANKTSLKIYIIAINIVYILLGAIAFAYLDIYYPTWETMYIFFWLRVGDYSIIAVMCLLPFLLTSYLYSCPPLRAKARPWIDGLMNILYIITPLIIGTIFARDSWNAIVHSAPDGVFRGDYIITVAFPALCRCVAMHCYSAIPDIVADRQAGLITTAVYLGKQKALIYCGILYLLSALLSFPTLGWMSIIGGVVYLTMITISYRYDDIFRLYKKFPLINLIVGFCLFWYIVLFL